MAALVIGNAAYPDGSDLKNPTNDADDLAVKLESYGFQVIIATNCLLADIERKLKEFKALLETHEVGLFFFAGHGMQIDGSNYLLAIDTDMNDEVDAKHSSLALDKILDIMAKSKAMTKIIILDACRNNPWERKWHRGGSPRGLASVYAPKGTIIGFATSPGEYASDGAGRNGTYTAALLQHIDTPDCSIETMFKRVRNTVAAATNGKQTSWEHTSLSGEFFFNMSLGNLIDAYSGTALADANFILDETKMSHKIIAGLKSLSWYTQNSALSSLSSETANRMATDSLFVIGRNIYQAACGSSNDAIAFIRNFYSSTRKYQDEKRKAILDGILFEIFFDSKGELRKSIKDGFFDEVFELERHVDLKSSFEFIAESLVAARANFYVVPGKGHELAVTVSAKKKKDSYFVDAIYVVGANVLRNSEDELDSEDGKIIYSRTSADRLNKHLSAQLVVPTRSLKITYTPEDAARSEELRIPMGWSARK
jgi:hypothetical protein